MQAHTLKPGAIAPTNTRHVPVLPDIAGATLMRAPAVAAACGISKSYVWLLTRTGKFPQPIRFGTSANGRNTVTAWRTADVAAWLADPAAWQSAHGVEG